MRRLSVFVLLTSLVSCVAAAAPLVRITARVDGGPQQRGWVYARAGQEVILETRVPGAIHYRWFRLEPDPAPLDNTRPSFHFAEVRYHRDELTACRDQPRCPAQMHPTRMPTFRGLEGLGTMPFQVEVTRKDGTVLTSPGIEARERGGLSREVFRVTFRRDDSYLGHLTELLNTPYIFGSSGPEGSHQADLLIGSDCADLTVYAARRSGVNVPYVSTWTIDRHAKEVARAERSDPKGIARRADGKPVRIGPGAVRPGDLLLFPGTRHVAVLWEDTEPLGVLDESDLMFHTCWAPPTLERISDSGCASFPVRVLRFPFEGS